MVLSARAKSSYVLGHREERSNRTAPTRGQYNSACNTGVVFVQTDICFIIVDKYFLPKHLYDVKRRCRVPLSQAGNGEIIRGSSCISLNATTGNTYPDTAPYRPR